MRLTSTENSLRNIILISNRFSLILCVLRQFIRNHKSSKNNERNSNISPNRFDLPCHIAEVAIAQHLLTGSLQLKKVLCQTKFEMASRIKRSGSHYFFYTQLIFYIHLVVVYNLFVKYNLYLCLRLNV